MSDTLKGDDLHQRRLFVEVMEKNREERLEREFLAEQHYEALRREKERAWSRKMGKNLEEFRSNLPTLKEELYAQVKAWLRETGAEPATEDQPAEVEIYVPSRDQLNKTRTVKHLRKEYWTEEALELSLKEGAVLWIKSTDKNLYGAIDGFVYYNLEDSRWEFPDFCPNYRGEEGDQVLPTKHRTYWDDEW